MGNKKIREMIRENKMERIKATKEANVKLFIVEWEKHQCFWNVTSEEYKDCIKEYKN